MKFRPNKMLGIAIGERSILVAEAIADQAGAQVTRGAEFIYSDPTLLNRPDELGAELLAFLKREGFTARTAVVGVPAKWVLTKLREVPPIAPALAADLLRLQVESEFSAELKDLVFDYAGQADPSHATRLLMAAMPQKQIDAVKTIADVVKLHLSAICPTAAALNSVAGAGSAAGMTLSITRSGTELAAAKGSAPTLLRHLGAGAAINALLAGEVRRASIQLGAADGLGALAESNGHAADSIVVWNDFDATSNGSAAAALGPGARMGNRADLGAAGAENAAASAVALAVGGLADEALPLNFLHSRLAPPRQALIPRRTALMIGAGLALVIGVIYAYVDMQSLEGDLADKQAIVKKYDEKRKPAEAEVKMIKYAQGWHAETPRHLACLRDLTNDIPDEGGMYVTSFNLHETMKGTIAGKATTDKSVLTLVERLKSSKRFQDVKMSLDTRDVRSGREVTFTISFRYIP